MTSTLKSASGIGIALLACALAITPPASAQSELPDFGDASGATLSPAEERRMGEAFMREVHALLPLLDDPEIQDYVNSVGRRLAAASDAPARHFHFFVVALDEVNAFAGPGGYIGINAGLIVASENEGELASVLAHEMAHVTQRHIARRFEQQERSSLPVFAGIVAAVVLGSQSPDLGQAAAAAILGTAVQTTLNFSREAEQEADRVGMNLLVRAGYDPRDMVALLETLQTSTRFNRAPPEYLSTHPLTTSRIADIRARADQFPHQDREDSLRFRLLRAKLQVLMGDDPEQVTAHFKAELEEGEHEGITAAAYGLGLALSRAGTHDKAREIFHRLVQGHPDQLSLRIAAAENELSAGMISDSIEIYEEAHARHPSHRALVLGLARALLRGHRGDEALATIDTFARSHAPDHRMHRIAAEAYAQQGEMTRSRFSLAEHYYLSGQIDAAIYQLRLAAQDAEAGYYLLSRVEARLEELEQERRQRLQPRA